MAIRISNLRLGLDEPEESLGEHLARVLGLAPSALGSWRILRKSLDARVKESFHFVYSAEVQPLEDENHLLALAKRRGHGELRIERQQESPFTLPPRGSLPLEHRPVVIGSGPAGL